MRLIGTIGAAVIALGLGAVAASAAPVTPPSKTDLAMESLVEKTHGVHERCAWSDRSGWHRSVYGGVSRCRPRSPGGPFVWYCSGPNCGWWHPRERYWHHHRHPNLYLRIF